MTCRKPFRRHFYEFGCGQCLPCRIRRRKHWTHRLILESFRHENSSFLTLTYDAGHLPEGSALQKSHVQKFIKRLRKAWGKPLRYYAVGEYGEEKGRPHYHAIIFGLPGCLEARMSSVERAVCGCVTCTLVRNCWGMGRTDCAFFTSESAQYVAGYVSSKTKVPARKEFAVMSLRPGLGANSLTELVELVQRNPCLMVNGDVPTVLRHGSVVYPLGRYLRQKLRLALGMSADVPGEAVKASYKQVFGVFREDAERAREKKKDVYKMRKEENTQKVLNIERRQAVRNNRKGNI